MDKCECGHASCFHKIAKQSALVGFFVGDAEEGKACNVKECACLRYTKVQG
jgi:hypothetical protein